MSDNTLADLSDRLAPGGRVLHHERLRGGISTLAERVDLERADGTRFSVTVRRSAPDPGDHAHVTPEKLAYEWSALHAVRRTNVPAPEPLLLDIEGTLFGTPAIVLAYIPGKPRFPGDDPQAFAESMAGAMTTVHAVTPAGADLASLTPKRRDAIRDRIAWLHTLTAGHPLAQRVHTVLEDTVETIDLLPECLVHGDVWSGNLIWDGDRLTGIVDWAGCGIGDPRADVCELRVDMALSHSLEATDAVLTAYERASGRTLPGMWFFDLYRGLEPLVEYEHWLEGYRDFGMPNLASEDARDRIQAFVMRALGQALA